MTNNPETPEEEPAVLGVSDTEVLDRAHKRARRQQRRDAKKTRSATGREIEDGQIVFIYEPHVRYVPPLGPYLKELWNRRAFAQELARSKVRGSRSNTVLGGVWALIDPLFMVCLYYFLFTVLRDDTRPGTFIPLIIAGILHFQVAGASVTEGGKSVSSASNLMLNSTFPRLLLPISTIYSQMLKFLPSIPIIFISFFFLEAVIGLQFFWWFPLFFLQLAIGLGLALFISTLVVFFADIGNVLTYLSRLMFFTSPVIYPAEILPENMLNYVKWSPFFGVFFNYQRLIQGQNPDTEMLLLSLGWAVGSILVGTWLFMRYEREFVTKL